MRGLGGTTISCQSVYRFIRQPARPQNCAICGAGLVAGHQHLIEPAPRKLVCACDACALLFGSEGSKYKRVPRRARFLDGFGISDAQWDALAIPIDVAFFFENSIRGKIVALYSSASGPVESLVSRDAWDGIALDNPALAGMESDVEALLVNRAGKEYFLVPIDKTFELVGLIRAHRRGLSGGTEIWEKIRRLLTGLRREHA